MISDERLREAARQAEKNLLASLPEPEDCEATFSPEFKRKMKKLVCRTDHPVRYWVQKAVACILLTILIGGGSVITFSTEARAVFVGWVREIYETWFVYHFEGESNDAIGDTQYRPTWLPEGYSQTSVPESDDQVNVLYTNDVGHMIIFAYSNSSSSLTLYTQGDAAETTKVMVKDIPADFYLEEDSTHSNCLVWENSQNNIIFWIVANLPKDTIIKIAESVEVQQ